MSVAPDDPARPDHESSSSEGHGVSGDDAALTRDAVSVGTTTHNPSIGRTLGRYRIVSKLGEGGMGVVYRAQDERLNRAVALKMIRPGVTDDRARARLWREARAAASLVHPNVCQLYEIGEENDELFLIMELLEGEPLSTRLARGPIACGEAIPITLSILEALSALHHGGFVHRDLKPSNVFLTPHGVKLLDFGLARPAPTSTEATETNLTLAGTPIGTPNYMAPEQVLGQTVDARADIFSLGCVLFEMVSGKPPFARPAVVDVLHAITADQPPTLGGSPTAVAAGRVVHQALAKNPRDRFATVEAMAQHLRGILAMTTSDDTAIARPMNRLLVLPFRLLRPDPSTEFLAYSLPDAITSALSGLDSLMVRSLMAARFASDVPDWNAMAREANVDIVLTGTLLRLGDQLRVTAQLIDTPGGAVEWSHTSDVSLGDLFHVQDELTTRIVESLALPLTARDHRVLKHDVPSNAKAYEFYLRANQLADQGAWTVARDLYLQCVEGDHRYAPAWARLGRVYRMLGKFSGGPGDDDFRCAEQAFQRALNINADLSLAHNQYARLEIDFGRAQDAMVRLLQRAHTRRHDPELFAALVQACRYCGLLDASRAAHEEVRRLDTLTATSVTHTYFLQGQYQQAVELNSGDPLTRAMVLIMLGRDQEARRIVEEVESGEGVGGATVIRTWAKALRLILEGRRLEAITVTHAILPPTYRDPESMFYVARQLAHLGEQGPAVKLLTRAVAEGFFCLDGAAHDPWFEMLRGDPAFTQVIREAAVRSGEARTAFLQGAGDQLLGV